MKNKKRTFRVNVEVLGYLEIEVEAGSSSEARKIIRKRQEAGEIDLSKFDFSPINPLQWPVEEVLEEGVKPFQDELEDDYLDEFEDHNLSDIPDPDDVFDKE